FVEVRCYTLLLMNVRSHFTLASRSSRSRCACCSFAGGGGGLRTSPLSTSATKRLNSDAETFRYPSQNFGSKYGNLRAPVTMISNVIAFPGQSSRYRLTYESIPILPSP